jgi:3-methylcrotonyl-CoA carboxylase alpha subunit
MCRDAGIIFVGPTPESIRLLGDKIAAKNLMAEAGVPIVPGYNGEHQEIAPLEVEAEKIGYPLLIKAAAGGGGRGMRVAESQDAFLPMLEEAKREARAAFGDERVLLERYIARSRHIEFQIFGDTFGSIVHLFERECSIQRRHQKILEESPSPVLTPELREQMAAAAVAAGKAANYVGAGTVEFLFDEQPDGNHKFYFLEVNTRLQVEHPVTELLTGIDLVQWQFAIANGKPLPLTQEQIQASGHVLEARIYAEDAAQGFLPSVGKLVYWKEPTGAGIRVDSGVEQGGEVSPYYDPMLAKLIVRGQNRAESLSKMEQALLSFPVLGVQTNIAYLLAIVRHPVFQTGTLSTRFLAEHFTPYKPDTELPAEVLLALAAYSLLPQQSSRNTQTTEENSSLWQTAGTWRNG